MFCPNCGYNYDDNVKNYCPECGTTLRPYISTSFGDKLNNAVDDVMVNKNKVIAGILAIILGGLGIHKFYLGYIGLGIVYILFCWTCIPSIIGIIEGIIYLCSTNEEFERKYVKHR